MARRILSILFALAAAILMSGCFAGKTVSAHKGCDTGIAAHKKGACHTCLRRGPRFVYKPMRAPGQRCIRR